MTTLVPAGEIPFMNGEPYFPYTACYRCVDRGNGQLFRLVNADKHQWAFYNDTPDLIFHVTAVLTGARVVKALQRTSLRHDAEAGTQVATLDVSPGFTELFLEGEPEGCEMHFTSEVAPAEDVQFEYRRPTVPYDKIYKCFKNNGNGLLFRLVDETNKRWYFYNDTRQYYMAVTVDVQSPGEVTPVGATVETPHAGGTAYTLEIPPGATERLFDGLPSLYTLTFEAREAPAAADDDVAATVRYEHAGPDPAIMPNVQHVYKCFKDSGNGLLFRLVDDVNRAWAFYNDTPDCRMVVNVRFPPEEAAALALPPTVTTFPDDAVPGGVVAGTVVPPLATVPFLVGAPARFELAFSAEPLAPPPAADPMAAGGADSAGVTAAAPEAVVPEYANGGPDAALFPDVDEVYKCFKEHGNGLLFRLVSRRHRQWAYYNDTTDIVAHVEVRFEPSAGVTPLGTTRREPDPQRPGEFLFVADVPPLHTTLFAHGDIQAFTTRFTASKVA